MAKEPSQQAGLWDLELEDTALEAMVGLAAEWDAAKSKMRNASWGALPKFTQGELERAALLLRCMAAYNETVKSLWQTREFSEGTRVRIGGYVIETKKRAGGGISVPTWEKNLPGKPTALPIE